jgi:hypothetical protein
MAFFDLALNAFFTSVKNYDRVFHNKNLNIV